MSLIATVPGQVAKITCQQHHPAEFKTCPLSRHAYISLNTLSEMASHPDTTPAARDVLMELIEKIDTAVGT